MTTLRDKYLATYYRVNAAKGFTLRVGFVHEDLKMIMQVLGFTQGCYITAANPESKPFNRAENAARNEALWVDLTKAHDLMVVPGIANGPDDWREDSYLALGLTLEEGQRLGRKYQQNAILWFTDDAVPELVMLAEGVE